MRKEDLSSIALGVGEVLLHSFAAAATIAVIYSFFTGHPIMPLDIHAAIPIIPAPVENPLPLPFVGGGAVGAELAAQGLRRSRRTTS